MPHGDGLVGTVDCCNHNGHSDGIVPIGRIEQNSSHIVGPDCNWCPWDRTRHNESHLLRSGMGLGFPSVVVFMPRLSRWSGCSRPGS